MATTSGSVSLSTLPSPRPLSRTAAFGVAIAALLTVGLARLGADKAFPGLVPPFFLLYPAVLIATLLAGWRAGLGVLGIGGLFTWTMVMDHPLVRPGGTPPTLADFIRLCLFVVSAGAVIGVSEAYRRYAARARVREARQVEAALANATAETGMGVWEWRAGEIIASAQAKAICGLPPGEIVTPAVLKALIAPGQHAAVEARIARAADPGAADLRPYEFEIVLPDGERRWLAVSGHAVDDGEATPRIVGAVVDITSRKVAEEALAAAANRLHHVSEAGRLAVWQVERGGLIHDPDLNAVLGYPPEAKLTPEDVRSLYLPGELARLREITAAAWARGQRNVEVEAQIRRPDGEVRWVMLRGELGLDPQGQVRAAMGVTVDITERKAEEERLNLLAQEVNHRANNLLAVVQGAVQLSKAATPEQLKEVVLGRIKALGRANQLLSDERWAGADLHRLVDEELAAFSLGEDGRVNHEGPVVALNPAAAQALALALHELATNAAKYGALTTAAGRVSVSWKQDPRLGLTVMWRESGGPPVSEPARQGQGVTLLAHALAGSLGGASTLHWRPEGLICTLELPPGSFEETA